MTFDEVKQHPLWLIVAVPLVCLVTIPIMLWALFCMAILWTYGPEDLDD